MVVVKKSLGRWEATEIDRGSITPTTPLRLDVAARSPFRTSR